MPLTSSLELSASQTGAWIETLNVALFAWIAVAAVAGALTTLLIRPTAGWGDGDVITLVVLFAVALVCIALAPSAQK